MNVREALDNIYKEFEKSYEEARKEGYNEGFENGNISDDTFDEKIKEAYENGLNDVWECVNKMYSNMEPTAIESIFGVKYYDVFEKFTASEAMAKVKEYEKKQKQSDDEITVGDEIYSLDKNYKSVVTAIFDTCRGVTAVYFTQNGELAGDLLENLHKTGRHFPQIAEVLKQMQEGNE